MPKYRLLVPHYINDQLLPEGTEVGDGTKVPFDARPSLDMEGLDEASMKLVAAEQARFQKVLEGYAIESERQQAFELGRGTPSNAAAPAAQPGTKIFPNHEVRAS